MYEDNGVELIGGNRDLYDLHDNIVGLRRDIATSKSVDEVTREHQLGK